MSTFTRLIFAGVGAIGVWLSAGNLTISDAQTTFTWNGGGTTDGLIGTLSAGPAHRRLATRVVLQAREFCGIIVYYIESRGRASHRCPFTASSGEWYGVQG